MSALALISDLLMQSQVRAAAAAAGVELMLAVSEDALIAQMDELRPRLVIVDLSHPGLDPGAVMSRLRPFVGPGVTSLAFGPHVHKGRLAAAADAGFAIVLSRGQFHAEMAGLLAQYGED